MTTQFKEEEKSFSILDQNAFDPNAIASNPRIKAEVERRQNLVGPMSVLFYKEPLDIETAKGVWIYDTDGKAYLDVYNNVQSVGHCNEYVTKAITAQFEQVNCHNRYLSKSLHDYTERLLATMPSNINRMMMTCTGSESNDLAIRCARKVTGKQGVIVTKMAYHGNTDLVSQVSPSAMRYQQDVPWLETIDIVAIINSADPSQAFVDGLTEAIAKLDAKGYGCAAFLADTIFSSDGVYSDPHGFMKAGIDYLHSQGALYIADEVQPGFCRTGTMWGFERHGLTPDIVTMGKPMGNGYPAAAVATSAENFEIVGREQGYFNTFGGSHGAVAAATAVLDYIENENLLENVNTVSTYLRNQIDEKVLPYPIVSEVRSCGFFYGIDIVNSDQKTDPQMVTKLVNTLKENGVLVGTTGYNGSSLKLRPQLIFSKENADFLVEKLCLSIKAVM